MEKRRKLGYGSFMQDGGSIAGPIPAEEQMMAAGAPMQDQVSAASPGGGGEIQAVAQEFVSAFMQLPPEAQQLILQTLMQGG